MKFLFIGNSHTYMNEMPYLFKQICEANVKNPHVTMLTHSGQGFAFYEKEQQTAFNIQYGDYDFIFLQHRAHPMGDLETEFYKPGRRLLDLIAKTKSVPCLFMTWSEKAESQRQEEMTRAYLRLGEETGALVAPVGLVWQEYQKTHSDELYGEDGAHASKLGSWLTAYTLYASLFGDIGQPAAPEHAAIHSAVLNFFKAYNTSC